jgi:hypothetical protein
MAMKMLEAGGMPLLVDDIRRPDDANPNGYYEFERVKDLEHSRDALWLSDARGKAVKIISFLLTWLPETYDYKVVFMDRDLSEVLASQRKMLVQRGEAPADSGDDRRLRAVYETHLEQVSTLLSNRACFSTLRVSYRDALLRPAAEAERINRFVGGTLDLQRMAAVASPQLYRNRLSS